MIWECEETAVNFTSVNWTVNDHPPPISVISMTGWDQNMFSESLLFLLLSVCVFCLPLSVCCVVNWCWVCVCAWCILRALCVPRSLSRYHLFSHVVLDWHPAHWIEYESPWPAVRLVHFLTFCLLTWSPRVALRRLLAEPDQQEKKEEAF